MPFDYPTDVPAVGLSGGKFTDGDPLTALLPSLDRAADMNLVYDALKAIVVWGGLTPTVGTPNQVRDAIIAGQGMTGPNPSIDKGFPTFNGTTGKVLQNSNLSTNGSSVLRYAYADNGAGSGPNLELARDSTSPAVNDVLAQIKMLGRNSAAAEITYARIQTVVVDPTAAAESGLLSFVTRRAGADTPEMVIGGGVLLGGAGSAPGDGKINAVGYKKNNTEILGSVEYISPPQSISNAGTVTITHGLGGKVSVEVRLVCLTAEQGHSIGDELIVNPGIGFANDGVQLKLTATQVICRYGSSGIDILHATTGAPAGITPANWNAVFVCTRRI